jgi:putative membrane protein
MKLAWLAAYFTGLVWSVVNPHDYFTWFLEASPALIALPILAATRKRFPLTPLSYTLILIHCLILFLGAHYTYAQVETLNGYAISSVGSETTTISLVISPKASCRQSWLGKF